MTFLFYFFYFVMAFHFLFIWTSKQESLDCFSIVVKYSLTMPSFSPPLLNIFIEIISFICGKKKTHTTNSRNMSCCSWLRVNIKLMQKFSAFFFVYSYKLMASFFSQQSIFLCLSPYIICPYCYICIWSWKNGSACDLRNSLDTSKTFGIANQTRNVCMEWNRAWQWEICRQVEGLISLVLESVFVQNLKREGNKNHHSISLVIIILFKMRHSKEPIAHCTLQ